MQKTTATGHNRNPAAKEILVLGFPLLYKNNVKSIYRFEENLKCWLSYKKQTTDYNLSCCAIATAPCVRTIIVQVPLLAVVALGRTCVFGVGDCSIINNTHYTWHLSPEKNVAWLREATVSGRHPPYDTILKLYHYFWMSDQFLNSIRWQ